MTTLGKCLVFHFKYPSEMKKLYWQEGQEDDEQLPNETLGMVRAVGKQSCEEARAFLDECSKRIQNCLDPICSISECPSFGKEPRWSVWHGIWPKGKQRPHNKKWKMKAGVEIPTFGPAIFPWVWATGNSDAEELMRNNFGNAVIGVSRDIGIEAAGYVALARIPTPTGSADGFDVDSEPLLKAIEKAFSQLSQNAINSVYAQLH